MMEDEKVDFGSVQVHRKVIADITALTIQQIEGASLIEQNFLTKFIEFLGKKSYSGITVEIDKNNQINLTLRVRIRYGMNISDTARLIQDEVRGAVERAVDLNIKDIQVNVEGIERGEIE